MDVRFVRPPEQNLRSFDILLFMDDDQINDLKQFIAATVSQSTALLATNDDLKRLEQKIDDGFAGVGEAIEELHKQQSDTDQRLTKLEQQAA